MRPSNEIEPEIEALRERLLRLSEASLRVGGSLDLDAVLSEAVDGARALTGARYGGLTLSDESGELQSFVTSGLTEEEREAVVSLSGWDKLFDLLSNVAEPMRLTDFLNEATKMTGVESDNLPDVKTFLGAPISNGDVRIGNFYLAEKEGDQEFSDADEETLALFASHAATAIVNARQHHDEQRTRMHLEALIEMSPVGVLVLDAKTESIESLNREAMRMVNSLQDAGQSLEGLMATVTIRRADGQDMSVAELMQIQTLSAGEKVRAEEIVFRVSDGRSVTALMNATPIHSEEGEVQSFVVTLQDMTPLEELERLRAEFLGMVSHELRAPLTSIKGSASTLISSTHSLDPVETLQFHRIIDDQADHMRELITDLLDVARVETGSLTVSPTPYDVVMLVDQAKNAFLSAGGRNNLELNLDLDLPQVVAERRRIVQVLNNLMSNAAKHSPEASTIRIRAVRDGVHVAFSVEDYGRGLSKEVIPHLFRKHSRINANDRSGIMGSGLGLAICKGIVEAHGGRIWAESEGVGMGSRFTFTLPAILDPGYTARTVPVPARASKPPTRSRRSQTRILVVDDDPRTLRYVRDALTDADFLPIVTADPLDVQRIVKEERPHLVLLDLILPGMDGLELMRSVPELAGIPVIFISSYGRDQVIAQALESGAADYVVKPFSPTELVARIRSAIRRQISPQLTEPTDTFVLGDLAINYGERSVTLAGRSVRFTNTEYRLLSELSVNAGRVLTHSHLLQRVWGMGHPGHPGPVRTVIKNLRRKLEDHADNPRYIFSEPRVGYRMAKGDEQQSEV